MVTWHHPEPELVSSVRDRERLRQAPRTLLGRRLAVGEGHSGPVVAGGKVFLHTKVNKKNAKKQCSAK